MKSNDEIPFNYSEMLTKASDRVLSNLNIYADVYAIRGGKDSIAFKRDVLNLALYKLKDL